jgi:hypothetical protein
MARWMVEMGVMASQWWRFGLLCAWATGCGDDATQVGGEDTSLPGSSSGGADGSTSSGAGAESTGSTGASESSEGGSSSSESSGGGSTGAADSSDASSTGAVDACAPPTLVDTALLDCDPTAVYRTDAPGVPTVHMVSLYEPLYFGQDAPVHFDLPGTNTLVLASYSSVQWAVELGPQGELDQVWYFGGDAADGGSSVSAPEGVEVFYGGAEPDTSACNSDASCVLDTLRAAYAGVLGLPIDEADRCYAGQHFEYEPSRACGGTPGASLPDCAPQDGPSGMQQDECAAVVAEGVHCATYDGQSVVLVGMESGNSCVLTTTSGEVMPGDGGLAWIGDAMYVCAGTIWEISTIDGTATDSGTPCAMVADYDGQILVQPGFGGAYGFDEVVVYPDFAAAQSDSPSVVQALDGLFGLKMATDGDSVFAAWFAGDKVLRWDIGTGERQPDAPLLCWEGFIDGVDVLDGTAYVFSSFDQFIKRFDASTGQFLSQVGTSGVPGIGLACRPGG